MKNLRILDIIDLIEIPSPNLSKKRIIPDEEIISSSLSKRQLGQVFDDVFRNYLLFINYKAQKTCVASTFYRGHNIEKLKPTKENINRYIQRKFRKDSKSVINETEIIYNIIHSIDYSKFIVSDIIFIDLFLGNMEARMEDRFGLRNPHYVLEPDLVVNEMIIDVKFTDKTIFTHQYFYQLLLYYIWIEFLKKEGRNNPHIKKTDISTLGIFFPKQDLLYSFNIKDVIPANGMKPFMDYWFNLIRNNYPFLRKYLPLLFSYKKDPDFFSRPRKVDQFTINYVLPQLELFSKIPTKIINTQSPELENIILGLISEIVEEKYRTIKYSIKPNRFLPDNDIRTLGCREYLERNFNAHSKYLENKRESFADKLIFLIDNKIKDDTLKDLILRSSFEYSELQRQNNENFETNKIYIKHYE